MRLLTRSDFDGLACGALLTNLGLIDGFEYVHPKDVQDGKVVATENDILANVPYIEGCGMWFDHHSSENERNKGNIKFKGESRIEKSAARIIYDYFGGDKAFPNFKDMIYFVDKVDSADLTTGEILNPYGWILIGFLMDPRTGLGRFRNYRISNYQLMAKLMALCGEGIDTILKDPDVIERVEVYKHQNELFRDMLDQYTKIDGNCIITDLRGVETIYSGNRFLIYSLYPGQNISVWVVDGRNKQNVALAVGHSVIKKDSQVDVGSLMLKYGGGGHKKVGTCQVPYEEADEAIQEIVKCTNI
ncbi:MAG: exopolyphosphatase [Clostridiales bacterium]|nr:exopolyphosphatase [Clostridiales bacterium]